MDSQDQPSKHLQIRVTIDEWKALTDMGEESGEGLQGTARGMLQEGISKKAGKGKKPNAEWHERLDFILAHGDDQDVTTIQRSLEWAASDLRTRPKRKRA